MLSVIIYINSLCISATEQTKEKSIEILINENVTLKFEHTLASPVETSKESQLTIKYPKNEITIIPPKGSDITDLSEDIIHIQYQDMVHGINFSETISLFSKMNYYSTINGLDDFNLKITSTDNAELAHTTQNITHYNINWGDNQNFFIFYVDDIERIDDES
jgi:hypothetical protein